MVALEEILFQVINGFALGSIYALIAMGLTIIFGLMGVVNIAHGAFYAIGAYVGFTVVNTLGIGSPGFFVALLVVPIVLGLIGAATELTIIRPLYDRDLIYSLLLTFGLMLVIHETIKIVWGTGGRTFSRPSVLESSITVGFVTYPSYRIFVVILTGIIALGVWAFLRYSSLGMIVRAATENRDMVKVLGINIGRIYTLVFALGIGIAGLAGLLHAPMVSVYPEMGSSIIIESFVVVVIGGLNSFRGSIFAGLLVGQAVSLSYLIWPPMTDVAIFLLMAVFLILRPQGIFGQETGGLE